MPVRKRHLAKNSVDQSKAPFALKGLLDNEFIKVETGAVVGPTTIGDQAFALVFATPFPTSCDFVFVYLGDQANYGPADGYEISGMWITARTKTGCTWNVRFTAAPGTAGNIYYTIFAIGK